MWSRISEATIVRIPVTCAAKSPANPPTYKAAIVVEEDQNPPLMSRVRLGDKPGDNSGQRITSSSSSESRIAGWVNEDSAVRRRYQATGFL